MLALAVAATAAVGSAEATVFYARDELAELAFPKAEQVEAVSFFLTEAQRSAIQQRASVALDSQLLTVYVGKTGGRITGYAILDTHLVRTLPETFLVVLDANGTVAATHIVAFHEPLEYMPGKRWLGLLEGHRLTDELRVGRAIAAVTGSTLSTRAVVAGVRRALAIYEVLLAGSS